MNEKSKEQTKPLSALDVLNKQLGIYRAQKEQFQSNVHAANGAIYCAEQSIKEIHEEMAKEEKLKAEEKAAELKQNEAGDSNATEERVKQESDTAEHQDGDSLRKETCPGSGDSLLEGWEGKKEVE